MFRIVSSVIVLGAAIGVAAFLQAGIVNSEWNWSVLAIGAVSFLYFLFTRNHDILPVDRITLILLGIIGGFALVQIVPLPDSFVAYVSPARAELTRAASTVAGPLSGWMTLSAVPSETIQLLLTLGAYGLLFLIMRDIAGRYELKWLAIWPLLIIAVFESGLGMLQADTPDVNSVATGTYANRDHYAGLLEMVLPFAVMYAIALLRRNPKAHESPAGPALKACGILAMAALILVAIIHSLSRMGFLAALASLFVTASIALSVRGWSVEVEKPAPLWRRMLPITAVALIVVLGFIFLPTDPLIARFSDLAKTDDISADTRAQICRETTGLVKAFPLFGCGLGGYESCFMRFKTVAPMFTVDYAHNDYLQILAELGIFAFLAGIALAFRLVAGTISRALYARSTDERFLMIGCTGALVAMLLHSFVDFNLYVPANGAVFAWICGIAASGISVRSRQRTTVKFAKEAVVV